MSVLEMVPSNAGSGPREIVPEGEFVTNSGEVRRRVLGEETEAGFAGWLLLALSAVQEKYLAAARRELRARDV